MATQTDLSIIILSFNTKDITLACLTSLYQQTQGLDFEVIVVDNASTDGSVEVLSRFGQKHSNFQLIKSDNNLGFGRGNNLGVEKATGEYLLFLNSDTIFTQNNLPYCLSAMRQNNRIGVYGCHLTNRDGSHQPSGGHFPDIVNLLAWQFFLDDLPLIGGLFKSIHPHHSTNQPDWVTGAFMIMSRVIFHQVGGFDENIFMYTEELELCYRVKQQGKTVVFDPSTSIVHLGGASGGSYLALTKEVEGIIYFWQKHRPSWELPFIKFAIFLGSLPRYLIFGIIKANATARASYSTILRQLF